MDTALIVHIDQDLKRDSVFKWRNEKASHTGIADPILLSVRVTVFYPLRQKFKM